MLALSEHVTLASTRHYPHHAPTPQIFNVSQNTTYNGWCSVAFLTKLVDYLSEDRQIQPLMNHKGEGRSNQYCICFIVSCWRETLWKSFPDMSNLEKVCQVHLA